MTPQEQARQQMAAQYRAQRSPAGMTHAPRQQREDMSGQDWLDFAAVSTAPLPIFGDVTGLAADASMLYNEPESRTPLNILLATLGLIPGVPAASSLARGAKKLKAYHGSPHEFDEFQMSKIGTGEGAQAYGHGLYFAEAEGTAKEYKRSLTRGLARFEEDGVGIGHSELHRKLSEAMFEKVPDANKLEVLDSAEQIIEGMEQGDSIADFKKFLKGNDVDMTYREKETMLAGLDRAESFKTIKPKGKMYEVALDVKPDELLDWDKALDRQSKIVRDAMAKVDPRLRGVPFEKMERQEMIDVLRHNDPNGVYADEDAIAEFGRPFTKQELIDGMKADPDALESLQDYMDSAPSQTQSGGSAYYQLTQQSGGGDAIWSGQAAVSEALNRYGVKGIKYQDELSRLTRHTQGIVDAQGGRKPALALAKKRLEETPFGDTQGRQHWKHVVDELKSKKDTKNYVIFDERLITISKKYGVSIPAAAAIVSSMDQAEQEVY